MNLTSNEPFWLLKNGIINSYPSVSKNISTDIVVIGAGITGSLAAHQCINDGYKVVIIDKREVANGSTSASTCMLQYEIDVPLNRLIEKIGEDGAVTSYKACSKAIDDLEKLNIKIKSGSGFKKKDSLYLVNYEKDLQEMQAEFETRKKFGFDVKWLDNQQLIKQYKLSGFKGGILSKQAASFDSFRFTHDLLAYNLKRGLKIYDKTAILKRINYGGKILFKTVDGFTVTTNKVIYCVGFEATELIDDNFVNILNTYAIAGEQNVINKELNNTLVWDSSKPYHYMRTTDDNRLLVGGEDEKYSTPDKKLSLLGKKTKALVKYANNSILNLNIKPDFAWCGSFGETKDGLPYIGTHKKFSNSFFVLGFGGNGITFSVSGMEMISAWLKGEEHQLQKFFKFGR